MPALQREGRQSTLTTSGAALRYTRNLVLVSWLILALPLSASAQEVAGRVISTVGEVVALRPEESERILGRGDEVYVGDRLMTAENGRAQIRFIDDGLVDLRPDSAFEVVEYQEADDQQSGSAAMEFTAGALRTITGRIGNRPGDEYDMSTDIASIGIRGTDYSLQLCDFDCAENGQTEGLYGRVDDGVVAITNQAGTTEFSQNQYFFVESEELMPQLLPAPPQNILDGSDDGDTAEDTTDDDDDEDTETLELAEADDANGDESDETEVNIDAGFVAGDSNTEDDILGGTTTVDRVISGSFQYDGTFFGGLVRIGEESDGSYQTFSDDGMEFLESVSSEGWEVTKKPEAGIPDNIGKFVDTNDQTIAYWGAWSNNDIDIVNPDGELLEDLWGGTLYYVFSDQISSPEQLSQIEGSISYTGVDDALFANASVLTNWRVEDISLDVNFSDIKVDQFSMSMERGTYYELEVEQSDITIENLLLLDFEFTGDWDYTYVGNPSNGDVIGNFSGQLIGQTADGMIFSIDMDRLDEDGVDIEQIIASGLLEVEQ